MKESIKKIFSILVLFIMIINSSFLTVISTAIDAIENLIDESKINPIIDINLEKYVNYNISDELKGVLLQANIKTGIEYEEGQEYAPIKATKTVVNLPQIDGKYPESSEVIAKNTQSTNGDCNGKDMYYSYDKEHGKLEIVVYNKENEKGDIYTENVKGTRDEFVIISNYGADCYNDEDVKRDLNITGTIEEILANEDATKLTKEYTTNFEVTENISGLLSTEVETSDIYNGYINSNKQNGTQSTTEYTENMKINISYKEISEEVTVETSNKFINTENKEVETNEIVYKSAKINKQKVIDILGEEGKLQILNKAGEILGEINKDTETQEDGTVEIKYEQEQTEIIIKTTKPEKIGTIEIENQKTIKETMTETENKKISNKNIIKCVNNVQEKDEETGKIIREYTEEKYNYENKKEIEIKESETKIDVNLDKTEWTNNVQNDVTITATLVTNGPQYNLFKNPVIEIKLPEEVEKVILGEASLLYDNNLSIKNSEVMDRENYKVIRIELDGIQSEYILNSIVNGVNVIIPATVILKKDINSVDTSISVIYTNESGIVNDYNNAGNDSKNIGIKINSMNSQTENIPLIDSNVQSDITNTDGLDIDMYAQVGSDVLKDGDVVYEDEVITYVMKVTNTSSSTIENIKFEGIVPEGTTYVTKDGSVVNPDRDESEDEIRNDLWIEDESKKQEEILIGNLSAGETITKTYKVKIDELTEDTEKEINSEIKAYVGNQEVETKTINSIVKSAKLSIGIYPYEYQSDIGVRYNWSFLVEVTNNTDENVINAITEFKLSDELNFVYCTDDDYKIDFDEDTRILKISMGDLGKKENVKFAVILSATNFSEGKYEYIIPINAKVYAEDTDVYRTDTQEVTAYYTSVNIVKESSTEGQKLECFQEIEYTITVTNEGLLDEYITIIDNMPEFITAKRAEYESYNYNKDTENYEKVENIKDLTNKLSNQVNDFEVSTVILQGESLKIKIYAQVQPTDKITEVENTAIVYGQWMKAKTSNIIKNTILPYGYKEPDVPVDPDNPVDPTDPDNPDNPDIPSKEKYNIDGLVWIDENKNGRRDDTESTLSGVTVKLFNSDTNAIVTDKNNNTLITTTNNEGKYEFDNIKQGNYLVLFEYDTNTYEITTYQKSGVNQTLNSDVIKKEVSIDGNTKQVGITDILSITNKDLNNIDMGLIKNPIFDLKLDKYISKITVSNSKGTTETTYENSKLAKVEIPAKQLDNSTVEIEYKIVVTNEGEVTGYISEVLDYLPSELTFDSDKNTGWAKTSNGELKNTSLSTQSIEPGESKELTLILTKEMTQNVTGRIINTAEIGETINTKNVQDVDSIEGNKVETEDDYSEAEVIISVKTGTIMYLSFILISLLSVVLIVYIMKKKNVNNKIIGLSILGIVGVFVITIFTTLSFMYVDGEEHVITESQLKEHVKNGTWESTDPATHPGAVYWCLNPGKHLGNGCDTYKYDADGSGNLDRIGNGTLDLGSVQWYLNAIHVPYNGTLKSFVETAFSGIGSSPAVNIVSIDNSQTKIKEKTASYTIVGPYTINYAYENCSDIKISLNSCKIDGSPIEGAYICNSDGTAINTCSSGGQIYIKVPRTEVPTLQIEVKLQTEEVKIGAWLKIGAWQRKSCTLKKNNYQTLITVDKEDSRVSDSDTEVCDTKLTGSILIQKIDVDTGVGLGGATFTITGPAGAATQNTYTAITGSDGKVKVENLLPGTYTVTETRAPSNYNLYLQTDKVKSTIVKSGETSSLAFYNKQYGNLLVTKKDADTGQTQIGGQRFSNIKFKLFVVKNGQRKYLNGNASSSNTTHYNYSDFNVSEADKAGAKTFVTNSNAQFAIQNLPVFEGANPIMYCIEEYELPSNLQEYYEVKSDIDVVTIGNGITVNKDIFNKQKYIHILGYVWDDVADENKQTLKNDLYEEPETLVKDITVRLKHKNGTTIDTKTTNKHGEYEFTKVKISELSNYYIEFEYNGLKYTNVKVNKNANNGSKASEKAADRTNFNNSYAEIAGGNAKENTTTGYSKNQNGNITNNLTYKNGTYSSSLVQNTKYTVASANGYVTAQNGFVGVSMKADTNTAGYTLKWTAGMVQITNVNLGITAREQPDMAISTDLNSIDLTLNGYSHTYTYNKRLKATGIDIFSEIEKWNKTDKEQEGQATNGYPRTYTRSIYKNYVYASGITGDGTLDEEDKLQVYLTYKIIVKNESSSLYMSANEIVNYYDKTLDLVESWYEDSNGNKVNVDWKLGRENNGYNQFRTDSLKDVKIEHGQSVTIYIKTKKNNVISWATKNEINDKTYNVTEIASYSSYTKSGNDYLHYAGIDKDSAPDNIIPGLGKEYVKRYEDDTDSAPVLEITLDEPRTISGYVFEDIAKYEDGSDETELHTGKERKGDGKYNASKDGYVENVKVELMKVSDNTTSYIYPNAVSASNFNAKEAVYTTTNEGKGYYEFIGIIPDEYYLKYTYGDGSVIYKRAGGTVNVTTQDYKSTIITSNTIKKAFGENEFVVDKNSQWYQDGTIKGYSAAVDDYETRTTINDALNEITYKVRTGYEDKEGDYAGLQTMTSRTPNMSIAIENTDNETTDGNDDEGKRIALYDNINFGIIERPRKSLETAKEIKYIRLILANGQVLAEGDPRTDSINYVTYPEGGNVKIEVDNELVDGATLEVTYEIIIENKSELDYDTQSYYKYGEVAGAKPVALTINSVIDHMDEELTTTYTYDNSSGWKTVEAKELRNKGLISNDVYAAIQNNHNILVKEDCNLKLIPLEGENIGKIEVNASKLLSTSKEMIYNNYAEVLKVSNSVGRFYGQINEDSSNKWKLTTPGNFIPDVPTDSPEEDDDKVIITIIPPTGQDMNQYVVLSVIGIGCLSLLVGGIVLIKKKILR